MIKLGNNNEYPSYITNNNNDFNWNSVDTTLYRKLLKIHKDSMDNTTFMRCKERITYQQLFNQVDTIADILHS